MRTFHDKQDRSVKESSVEDQSQRERPSHPSLHQAVLASHWSTLACCGMASSEAEVETLSFQIVY